MYTTTQMDCKDASTYTQTTVLMIMTSFQTF